MNEDSWFVCFFSRDSLYDDINRPGLSNLAKIRNSDIDTFVPAMKFIAESGGYAIRIGNQQKKKLNIKHDKIIDYSFSDNKNPKTDFLLSYYAKFIIGCGSGIVEVSSMNDVPVGLVNYPFYRLFDASKILHFIPKIILDSDNKTISIKEYINYVGNKDDQKYISKVFRERQWHHQDNSSDDILLMTKLFYSKFILKNKVIELPDFNEFDDNGLKILKNFVKKYPELNKNYSDVKL